MVAGVVARAPTSGKRATPRPAEVFCFRKIENRKLIIENFEILLQNCAKNTIILAIILWIIIQQMIKSSYLFEPTLRPTDAIRSLAVFMILLSFSKNFRYSIFYANHIFISLFSLETRLSNLLLFSSFSSSSSFY